MANFKEALNKVRLTEGGYVNDFDDRGGETYKGIARNSNPSWKGWNIIDSYKREYGINPKVLTKELDKNKEIQLLVDDLYKSKYWDIMELDNIPNQNVAFQLFDMCVNAGQSTAIKLAQRILGLRETGKWTYDLMLELSKYK